MNERRLLKKIYKAIDGNWSDVGAYNDAFQCIRNIGPDELELGHELKDKIRAASARAMEEKKNWVIEQMYEMNRNVLLYCAPNCTDDFILYMEIDRPYDKKFYLPRRKQLKPIVDELDRLPKGELDILGVSLPPGVGKALANDTPILTRNGWKNHGDLVVGDEVIGMDGNFKKVIAVRPKCMLDVLVEFTNGEKIVCHENHEWMVYDRPRHVNRTYIAETKRLENRKLESGVEKGHRGHRYSLQLPHRAYVVGEEKNLPLDPYTFGVWLGDGCNRNPTICCAPDDVATINKIVDNGVEMRWKTSHKDTGVLYFGFDIRKQLQEMGMCYSRRVTPKHIPETYLTAPINKRLELLAGLLDTDGSLAGSKYTFSTAEETLKDSFVDLVSTFGWRACVTPHAPCVSGSGVVGKRTCYAIGFTPDCEIPCQLERKRNRVPHKQRAIAFKRISRTVPVEGNCITVEGDGMYLAGRTMIPTHNTTSAEFFLTRLAGKNPELPILVGSHNNSFLRGMYGEVLRMLDPHGEYKWQDVFPTLQVINTNAQDLMIDIGQDSKDRKRFMTFEFTSIGSGNAGKVRAAQLLYCDDLVDGLESALSRERMDKLFNMYATDLRQRKIGNCPELHIATRWSVHDVIGRLSQMYGDSDKAKFLAFPALDDNDESNFDYPNGMGYSTKVLHEQRDAMDDASWKALYMNEPIEREGQLYPEVELRRYFDLPGAEYDKDGNRISFDPPDAIISICDTKGKGSDYCFAPFAYQYGQDFYIEDVLCDNSAPEIVQERLIQKHLDNNVQMSRFESNAAGSVVASNVQSEITKRGGRTKITTMYTTQNKETKIIVNAPWVKEHCLWKDNSVIKDREYRHALNFLCGYTLTGKNKVDDVPDGMAQFAMFAQSFSMSRAAVVTSPFAR